MHYRASFLAYAFWVHKNATPKNWLMRVKGLKAATYLAIFNLLYDEISSNSYVLFCAVNTNANT